jgi:nucleotide-binding universal stress UspA family protein
MMNGEAVADMAPGYGKILVVMDESTEVLKQGIRLAQEEKARVTVLKVLQPCEGDLHLTNSIAWSEGVQVKTRVSTGDITNRIVEVAHEEKCDLIVMGTRKRKGVLGRIFKDTTVRKVIDRANCPVYVVGSACETASEPVRSEQRAVEIFA